MRTLPLLLLVLLAAAARPPERSEWIVYSRDADGGGRALVAVRPDGTGKRELVAPASRTMGESHPALAPDGDTLYFATYRYGGWKLAAVDARTWEKDSIRRIGRERAYYFCPAVSPDGKRIAYEKDQRRGAQIWVANADGTDEREIAGGAGTDRHPCWDPTGSWIFFAGERDGTMQLQRVRPDGEELERVLESDANDFNPSVSPEGDRVAFYSDRNGYLEPFVLELESSEARSLGETFRAEGNRFAFDDQAESFKLSWSPDGTRLVLVSGHDGDVELYVVTVASGDVRRLTREPGRDVMPTWVRLPG